MEIYSKTSNGWTLFYLDKAQMEADVHNEEFIAQAKDDQVMNFWSTVTVCVKNGANIELVVRRLLEMLAEIEGELK